MQTKISLELCLVLVNFVPHQGSAAATIPSKMAEVKKKIRLFLPARLRVWVNGALSCCPVNKLRTRFRF